MNQTILPLLVCPKTGNKLNKIKSNGEDYLVTENNLNSYKIIHGKPILIDFENSLIGNEIIEFVSKGYAKRRTANKLNLLVKKILNPISNVTQKNVDFLLSSLINSEIISKSNVLIIGGGTIGQGLKKLYQHEEVNIISFDVYSTEIVDFIADAHSIPLLSSSFDCIIIQAVLEHVLQPEIVVKEIFRILKPSGIVYSETPFMQQVHEGPFDFTRYTESGHRFLFRDFEEIKSGSISSVGTQLMWSIEYFFRSVTRSTTIGKIFKLLFFWLQFIDPMIAEPYSIDGASGVFFIGKKNDRFLFDPKSIVPYYKGAQK